MQQHFAKTEKQNNDGFRVMTSDITAWNVLLGLIRATDVSGINQNLLLRPKICSPAKEKGEERNPC